MDQQTALALLQQQLAVLSPEQQSEYVTTVQAMELLRLNHLAVLHSTDLFAREVTHFLSSEQRPPQVQRLLEKQAEVLVLNYATELTKLLAEKNADIIQRAIRPPAPQVTIVQRAEPVREIEATSGSGDNYHSIAVGLSAVVLIFMVFFTYLFSDNSSSSWCAVPFILGGIAAIFLIWWPYLGR